MIEVASLSVAYGQRLVLRDLNFDLSPGKVTALIGPNGSGKTTLIRALSGLLPLRSGRVIVQERDLAHLSPPERARLIAVVPQARSLPPAFTALEMVMLGRTPHLNWLGQFSKHDEEAARQAMARTETLDLAERRVGELSGGEQQRLLLARAIAQQSPNLLMDEPTAHLDLKHQLYQLEQVRQLACQDGLTVLVVLHDLNLVARFADRVGLLVNGELVALGDASQVLNSDLLSQAYHVPLEVLTPHPGRPPMIVPMLR